VRTVITCGAIAIFLGAPVAMAARSHPFTAAYSGKGAGAVNGAGASGSATMSGRGRLIGASTLTGSANGTFTDPACVLFDGTGVLKGAGGSITLAARRGHACAATADAVSFSGQATVTGGTSSFAGARGTLTYTSSYNRGTGVVRVSLRGRIRY
jgi:hypothetical protein